MHDTYSSLPLVGKPDHELNDNFWNHRLVVQEDSQKEEKDKKVESKTVQEATISQDIRILFQFCNDRAETHLECGVNFEHLKS